MEFGVNTANWRRPESRWRPQWTDKQYRPNHYTSPGMYKQAYYKINSNNEAVLCFRCKMPGHFVKNCNVKISTLPKKTKSQRKKDRDLKRLTEFKARKTACSVLPFCDVSDDDLIAFMPKWCSSQHSSTSSKVLNVVSLADSESCKLKLVTSQLSDEVEMLKMQLEKSESVICHKESEIVKLRQKIQQEIWKTEELKHRLETEDLIFNAQQIKLNKAIDKARKLEEELSAKKEVSTHPQHYQLEALVQLQREEIMELKGENERTKLDNDDLQCEMTGLREQIHSLQQKLYNSLCHCGQGPGRRYNNKQNYRKR